MHYSIETRINKYIGKIEPIHKGNRNESLHNIGILIRTRFGQTGNVLLSALSDVNQTKCTPPLPESEVKKIAQSVNRSNAPIRESNVTYTGQQFRKTPKQEHRVVHTVVASDVPVLATDLLSKPVSLYRSCETKKPSRTTTIGEFLGDCKSGKYREQVEEVRAEGDKDKRDALKVKLLPCITPHCNPAEGKTEAPCEKAGRNRIASIDKDNIPEDKRESAKAKMMEHPSVFAAGISASGHGVFGLAAYEGTPDWDALLKAFQLDFPDQKIDMNCKGINRLRFASYDSALIIKQGEVFPAVLTEQTVSVPSQTTSIVSCGVTALDNILAKILPVDWEPFETIGRSGEIKPPSERDYILRTIDRILLTADEEDTPLVNQNGCIYYYTGTHYKPAQDSELRNMLIESAVRCGVPSDTAEYLYFVDKILKQFSIKAARHKSGVVEPDTPFINLQNGTLFFDRQGHRFEEHSPQRFIRYRRGLTNRDTIREILTRSP